MIDILVLLTAMLLEKKQYSRKTFNIYMGYVFLLTATALLDYFIDTWYLQNIAIFFSSMIISIDHMTQVSDQWMDTKKELLLSEYRASHDIMTRLWNKTSGMAIKLSEDMKFYWVVLCLLYTVLFLLALIFSI